MKLKNILVFLFISSASNQTESVNFICEAIDSGFETPLKWAAKIAEKRKAIDLKVQIKY